MSEMREYGEVWAEKGHVMTRDKDGTLITMTVQEAAKRANAINKTIKQMPKWMQTEAMDKVESVTKACYQAKRQIQDTKLAAAIVNAPAGLDAEGRISKTDDRLEHGLIASLCRDYQKVTEDEVARIVRLPDLPMPVKVNLVIRLNNARGGNELVEIEVQSATAVQSAALSG